MLEETPLHGEMLTEGLDVAQCAIEGPAVRIDRVAAHDVIQREDDFSRALHRLDSRQRHVDTHLLWQLFA